LPADKRQEINGFVNDPEAAGKDRQGSPFPPRPGAGFAIFAVAPRRSLYYSYFKFQRNTSNCQLKLNKNREGDVMIYFYLTCIPDRPEPPPRA